MAGRGAVLTMILAATWLATTPATRAQVVAHAHGDGAVGVSARRAIRAAAAASIVLDGQLTEPSWLGAEVASEFTQRQPAPGAAASRRTEARVLFDDAAVYIGMRLYDSARDSIAAQLLRRDDPAGYSDWASVIIDSYGDKRTAFRFSVSPAGVQRDVLLYDDTREDWGWNAVWDATARIDSLGWTVEMRIPLSQLRFAGGEAAYGINFGREIARSGEVAYWAPIPAQASSFVALAGQLRGLKLARHRRAVELLPYSLTRLTQAPGDPLDPFYRRRRVAPAAGGDLRVGLARNVSLVATINPDFGQVEADPAQYNLSAYESYFEEKRPFFIEGAELFRTGNQELFYSRRIGRAPQTGMPDEARFADQPRETPILGAAKLTGKTADGWSFGVLDAVTGQARARYADDAGAQHLTPVEPATNYFAGRLMRDFSSGASVLGVVLTSVHRQLGDVPAFAPYRTSAWSGGATASHRFGGGAFQAVAHAFGSRVDGSATAIAQVQRSAAHYFQRPDAPHLTLDTTRTSLGGYYADASVSKISGAWRWTTQSTVTSPGFEINDIGFGYRSDLIEQFVSGGYRDFTPSQHVREWTLMASAFSQWTTGGERTETWTAIDGSLELVNQTGVFMNAMRHLPALSTDALRGGPAVVKPGIVMAYVSAHGDSRRVVNGSLSASISQYDDGAGSSLGLNPSFIVRAGTRTSLSLGPSWSWRTNAWQYVTSRSVGNATEYVVGALKQRTVALTLRANETISPTLTVQAYAQPFLSAGAYTDFRRLASPRAARLDTRFQPTDFDDDPNFNFGQLNANVVLRWEYRSGSVAYLVWSQGRNTTSLVDGQLRATRDADALWHAPTTNVLIAKATYRLAF